MHTTVFIRFTVWYWATYPLKYLSKVILVGPKEPRVAQRLGVEWARNLDDALAMARAISGDDDVVALTMPPFFLRKCPRLTIQLTIPSFVRNGRLIIMANNRKLPTPEEIEKRIPRILPKKNMVMGIMSVWDM